MKFGKYMAAVLLILITGGSTLSAMPPHPDLEERLRREGRSAEPVRRVAAIRQKSGMNMNKVSSISSGTVYIPVILVQYAGTTLDAASTIAFYTNLLNGATASDLSVKKYYSDMSNGKMAMQFVVYGPVTVSQNAAYYGSNVGGVQGNDVYPAQLVNEAVNALITAQGAVDFSIYDNDKNGTVDTVIIIHCGAGEESPAGVADDIWSHQWDLASANYYGDGAGPVTTDGVTFNVYTIQPEYVAAPGDSTVGVFCHELGHVLGLPDLYDTTGATNGVGNWSLMGSGSWGDDLTGARPAPLLAWERLKIGGSGWINISSINPGGFTHRYDRNIRLLLLVLLSVLILVPVLSSRISTFVKGAGVSLAGILMTVFLSCGTDTSSYTRINGTVNDIETSHHAFRISLNDPYGAQYIFLEGKKASTTGWYVPGTGILVTHIHEGIVGTYSGAGTVNDGSTRVHGVNVIEASTASEHGNLWNKTSSGVAADLFCQENKSSLTVATTPSSRYYTGSDVSTKTGDSGVTVENISSNASFPMTFTATVE